MDFRLEFLTSRNMNVANATYYLYYDRRHFIVRSLVEKNLHYSLFIIALYSFFFSY